MDSTDTQQLQEVSLTLSAEWPTDLQVEAFLHRHHPTFTGRLSQKPRHVTAMYELHSKEARNNWRRHGKESPVVTLWTFWLRGLDIDWLERLEREASESQAHEAEGAEPDQETTVKQEPIDATEDPVTDAAACFAALSLSDGRHVKTELAEDVKPLQGIEDGSFDFMFAQPTFDSAPKRFVTPSATSASSSQSKRSSANSTPPTSPERSPAPGATLDKHGQSSESNALMSKALFLEWFSYTSLPFPARLADRGQNGFVVAGMLFAGDLWTLSKTQRQALAETVAKNTKDDLDKDSLRPLAKLVEEYEAARKDYEAARNDNLADLLQGTKIVGATTAGAARQPSVLKGYAPKVLVIEEAGQVLEAHVLATLFPSIQHVIALGDPLQLRPQISEHKLSVNSSTGKDLYRFDVSLMERLASNGLPMSQLTVQRRMRPVISSLVRNTLYDKLQDHWKTKVYPPVSGVTRNVFFLCVANLGPLAEWRWLTAGIIGTRSLRDRGRIARASTTPTR